jgi:hypothetical protein
MALKDAPRVQELCSCVGLNKTITLLGVPSANFSRVAGRFSAGDTGYFWIEDANGTAWECVLCTFNGTTLEMTNCVYSSSNNNYISLSNGKHLIYNSPVPEIFERAGNKATSVNANKTSNVKYPTVKAMYDWVLSVLTSFNSTNVTGTANAIIVGFSTIKTITDGTEITILAPTANTDPAVTLTVSGQLGGAALPVWRYRTNILDPTIAYKEALEIGDIIADTWITIRYVESESAWILQNPNKNNTLRFKYADAAARLASTHTDAEVGLMAIQEDNSSLWVLSGALAGTPHWLLVGSDSVPVVAKGTISTTSTVTFNRAAGSVQTLTCGGAYTLTWAFSGWPPTGNKGWIEVDVTNMGLGTLAFAGTVNWKLKNDTYTTDFAVYLADRGGETAMKSSGLDTFLFWTIDGGTTVYGTML